MAKRDKRQETPALSLERLRDRLSDVQFEATLLRVLIRQREREEQRDAAEKRRRGAAGPPTRSKRPR